MKSIKLNFTIPEHTASRLRRVVADGNRSGFVGAAIDEKLDQVERQQFFELLKEGYQVRRQEGIEINQEWEAITLEGWP